MTLAIEYFDAAGVAAGAGVFIPLADLPSLQSAELASALPTPAKEGRVMLALLNRINAVVSPDTFDKLGFAITKNAPDGVDTDIFNQSYSVSWQKLVDLNTDTVSAVPVPTTGANLGLGSFTIADIFPSAVKVEAAGAVASAGIVINTAGIALYSSLTQAALNVASDSRAWFSALCDHLTVDSVKRSATVASGVVSASPSTVTGSTIVAAFTALPDPTTGILAVDVPTRALINRTDSIVIQLQLNSLTESFDVLVALA